MQTPVELARQQWQEGYRRLQEEARAEGAEETLRLARLSGAEGAILKARSPSCGVCAVYDGSFTGRLRPGDGVAAALLRRAGITLRSGEPPTLPHP